MMKFYTPQHQFYCGIDLHAKTLHVGAANAAGQKLLHQNLQCQDTAELFAALQPFRSEPRGELKPT
ncbi:MAG: hypothetical protein U0795_11880 [Pirellulales bacterium]